jgi:quinol-cytochrome oxidoreductase complex cytochrome b subunit
MISRIFDPWFLLDFYETIFRILTGIVFLGVAVEFGCLLYLVFHEGLKKEKRRGV